MIETFKTENKMLQEHVNSIDIYIILLEFVRKVAAILRR